MKVLVAHNRYRSATPSGENVVVDAEIAALREAGVDVVAYLPSSDDVEAAGPRGAVDAARTILSREGSPELIRLLWDERPDVLHVHNVYPSIGPGIIATAQRIGIPVVQTLHNYRLTCMAGTHLRHGLQCTLCTDAGSPAAGVRHACYRSSRPGSALMGTALVRHRTTLRGADAYVAPSEFIRNYAVKAGIEAARITVRHHWVPWLDASQDSARDGLLFVGRLAPEKGLDLLLDAWRQLDPRPSLTLIGSGPEEQALRLSSDPGLTVLGALPPDEVQRAMATARLLVLPSIVDETFGLVAIEAMRAGLPIVATNRGALPEVVGDAGRITDATASALAAGIRSALSGDVRVASREARSRYELGFAPGPLLDQQLALYRDVLAASRRSA